MLSLLQELLGKGHTTSRLKIYMVAIAANHALVAGQSIYRNDLGICFLKEAIRLNLPFPLTIPFEPLQSAELQPLLMETHLLLALASLKRVGDLLVLSVSASCLEFEPTNCKVILKPRHGYVPKVLSTLSLS